MGLRKRETALRALCVSLAWHAGAEAWAPAVVSGQGIAVRRDRGPPADRDQDLRSSRFRGPKQTGGYLTAGSGQARAAA